MNYILVKVEVNMNADRFGGRDSETQLVISDDSEALEEYCVETYGVKPNPEKFEWTYYKIVATSMRILTTS